MDKIKILVVDDESRMRKLVKDFLGREGYQVLEAGDGMEAIKNNKFLYRQPCYGWRYFMLLLYIAHDISLVSLHAVSFEVVGCCSNLCN